MDDMQQAIAYAKADFSSSNQMFVDGLIESYGARLGTVLDLGCGPGDIAIRLARAKSSVYVIAVDASEVMVSLAHEAAETTNLLRRVRVVRGRIPELRLRAGGFDAIVSKDLLHHLPDPMALWNEVKRLGRPDAVVYMMDLFRPESQEAARRVVETVSADEHEILKRDFYNSLLAAFTPDEVRTQLVEAGLNLEVDVVSERHMRIRGLL